MRIALSILLLAACTAGTASAQYGSSATSTTAGSQYQPALSMTADGRYAVAWTVLEDGQEVVRWRAFDSAGALAADIAVDDVFGLAHYEPDVALMPSGEVVVVWTAHSDTPMLDVYAQRFDASGNALGGATLVNQTTFHSQAAPAIAADGAGGYVIAWHSWLQDGGDRGVYLRRYAADGTPLSDEQQVNVAVAYSQAHPAIAMASDGRFVVTWASWTDDGDDAWSYDVYARRYDATGVPAGDPVRVNTYTTDNQWHADVAMDDEGRFVVAWTSWGQDGDEGGVYARTYDAAGEPVSGEVQVAETTEAYQWLPDVAMGADGSFVAIWSTFVEGSTREEVRYRVFDASGAPEGASYPVNGYAPGYQWEPAVAWAGTELAMVWSSWEQDGDRYGVYARTFPQSAVAVEPGDEVPAVVRVLGNYPNPFSTPTRIRYALPQPAEVRVEVFDLLGRRVRTLTAGTHEAGRHEVTWDGTDATGRLSAGGVYLYRISAASVVRTGRMVLVR